ncbi:MAG: hypothetical protein QE164_02605 [Candidatus Nezhaarchaeota archaeon]|nr:hypothetical protein [Candidatus Nezhaarchaeota archaeon]
MLERLRKKPPPYPILGMRSRSEGSEGSRLKEVCMERWKGPGIPSDPSDRLTRLLGVKRVSRRLREGAVDEA